MRFLVAFVFVVVFFSCKKKDDSKPPEVALLTFPERNSECTTGIDLSATTSEVEFRWQSALNVDTYELRVTNLDANSTQTISTSALSARLPLRKGGLYSWFVRTKNTSVIETAVSETWSFYNSGFETTYTPFPAEILAPKLGATVFRDGNNQVDLQWNGADVDNDIEKYEVYLSTENPPNTLIGSFNSFVQNMRITVSSNAVYYWRVVTVDAEGNSSESGVYDFRTQ